MKINLDDNYRLTSTNMNVVVEKKFIIKEGKNKGNEAWRNVGNYSTVRQALKGYVGHSELDIKSKDIEGAIEELKQVETNIKNTITLLVTAGTGPWGRLKEVNK